MKNAFTKTFLLLAIIAFCLILSKPGGAQSNGQVTTAILTITNITTNGATISINGHVRTWTNIVTSVNNQISITNGTNATATNLLQSFQKYPEAQVFVTPLSSNSFQLQSYPGYSLTIATNTQFTNWISWVFTTNSITNETVVRVPPSSLGTVEQSNVETGIVQWLNLQWATNAVIATNTIWSNFISGASLAALSNYVGLVATNGTNFAQLVGQSTTNYASNQFVFATNYANTNWTPWSNIVFSALTWTTNTFNTLLKNVSYHDLGNVVGHGTNSILLTNTGPVNRIYMEDFAGALGGYSIFYRSDGSTIWIDDNVSVFGTTIRDANNVGRIEIGDGGDGYHTIFRGPNNNNSIVIQPNSDTINTFKPVVLSTGLLPVIAIGTFTNFFDNETNGSSATAVDAVTIPSTTLTNNGDTLVRDAVVQFTTTGAGRRVEMNFGGGTDLVDTGAGGLTIAGSGAAVIRLTITRTSSTAFTYSQSVLITGPATASIQASGGIVGPFNSGSGWTANIAYGFTLTGGTGGGITVLTDTVTYLPSHNWATFQ